MDTSVFNYIFLQPIGISVLKIIHCNYSITLQKYKKISIIARNGHFFAMPVILIPNYYKICIYSFFKGNGIFVVTKRHIYGHEMACF